MSQVILREANGRFATVQKLINQLQNPQPLLDQIGKILRDSTIKRITTTKVDPQERPWAPWAPATQLARMRKGNAGRGLLYDNGNLARSITYQVQGRTVTVGAAQGQAPYGIFLQRGTPKMPARPFIGVSAQDNNVVRQAVRDYLAKRT